MHLPLDLSLLLVIALQLLTIATCIERTFARKAQLMIRYPSPGIRCTRNTHVPR
jgi:hypothetical protein